MKRLFAVILVLAVIMLSVTCFAEEVYKPGKNDSGLIGTSSRYWRAGYFTTLNATTLTGATVTATDPDFKYTIASKDFGSATAEWTLTAAQQKASVIYCYRSTPAGSVIIAPVATGRAYTVFNHSDWPVTIKKSGGTGISISAGSVATAMFFSSATTYDYMAIVPQASYVY